jgi:hypothetical protein
METLLIEVFKTTIEHHKDADRLRAQLVAVYPRLQINFDLDDCDRIMRVVGHDLPIREIITIAATLGYTISTLPD